MKSNSVLIVGCGDLGMRTGALLQRGAGAHKRCRNKLLRETGYQPHYTR